MDLINAMLWGLSGYDKALGRWVELRQHYTDSPLMQGHVDRAILHHIYLEGEKLAPEGLPDDIATEAEQRCPNAEVTFRRLWDLAIQAYQKPFASSISPTHHLAVSIGGYALILGTYGNFGPAPWRRFVDIVNQEQELADAK